MKKALVCLLVSGLCIFLQGCGGSSSSSNNNNNQPQPMIAIQSPADGSVVTALPAKVAVSFTNGADPTTMRALMDGIDITADFGAADPNGVRQAKVDLSSMNLGKNQFEVTTGDLRASTTFRVKLDNLGSGSGSGLPLLVPIKTRVLNGGDGSKATDFNVAVYTDPNNPTLIQAPALSDGSNTGFQLVYLRRSDLSVISNSSFPNPDQANDKSWASTPFWQNLSAPPPPGCGSVGCLLILQSLGNIGYAPCTAQHFYDCFTFSDLLQKMGGSGRLPFVYGDSNPMVAYSYIGDTSPSGDYNSPVNPGTYYERLTCSGSNYNGNPQCDSLAYPNTSFTAPKNATLDQIGNISGALVLDNNFNYMFVQNAPAINFSTASYLPGNLQNSTNTITIGSNSYTSTSLNGSQGGFHLLILDRTTLQVEQEQTFPSSQNGSASQLNALVSAITGYKSYGNMFIVCAFGNTTYNGNPYREQNWYPAAQLMAQIGGTEQVFYQMNNPEIQPPNYDNYTLVGYYVDPAGRLATTGLENEVGAEMSSVIARETEAYPHNSDMEGVLKLNHQGFYSPKSFGHKRGLSSLPIVQALGASLAPPTPWPFPGNANKSQAAYTWISQQLCCDDIRSAYVNLNIQPLIWLDQLQELNYSSEVPNSDEQDFDDMKQQLQTEFQYVALVRQFQSNVTTLYTDQQATISLLLQQAANNVIENLQVDLNTPAESPGWISILDDVFGVGESIAGAFDTDDLGISTPVGTALAIGTLVLDQVAEHTSTPAGSSLQAQENVEITVGQMAGTAVNDFAANLSSLGSEFDRIVTDWGRLKTLGAPLQDNELPWDATAAGYLVQAYDVRVSREFYHKLLKLNNSIMINPYIGDTITPVMTYGTDNDTCDWPSFFSNNPQLLYYPNGSINNDQNGNGTTFPHDFQWGAWTLVENAHLGDECPGSHHPFPATFGLFQPLDPGNASALGDYRYWFYTRLPGYNPVTNKSQTPCYEYDGDNCGDR